MSRRSRMSVHHNRTRQRKVNVAKGKERRPIFVWPRAVRERKLPRACLQLAAKRTLPNREGIRISEADDRHWKRQGADVHGRLLADTAPMDSPTTTTFPGDRPIVVRPFPLAPPGLESASTAGACNEARNKGPAFL